MTKKVNLMTDANSVVNTVNEAVSQRIKRYRKQKKISLDELSRQAGVSKGALVEMEGCRANPSIALLCRLAAAMGVSVADFVDVSSEGTFELFYVQSGTLTLGVQDHVYLVKTGCSATARTDVPHFYENQGESPLVFIMTVHEKAS